MLSDSVIDLIFFPLSPDAFTPSPGSPPISSSLLESMNSEHGPTSTLVTSTSQLSLLDDLKLSSIPTSVQATPKPLPPSSQPVTLGSSPISKSSHQSPHAPQPIHTYPQILSLTSPTSSTSRDPAPHSSHPLSPPVITYQPSLPLTDSSSSSNIPTRTRSTTSSSSYSPSPAITRSSSGVSVLHQWQWLDANQSFDPQGTPRATSGTGDPKSELTATERRLQALDAYYRSGSGSQDIPLKQTLLTSRQQWLNDCISLTRDHHKSKVSLVHPSVGSINPKELKKTKSTVDRCKVYISNTHQIQSQPTGLDLWLWYKTMNDTLQPTAVPPSVPCASPLNLLSKRPGGDQAPEHRITNVNANQTQVSRPPINKLDYSRSVSHQPIQSNLGSKIHPPSPIPHHIQQLQHPLPHLQSPPHPHSRDVSHGSGSSVMSFPARSDAQKAIEITEKGGERLMEIINPPSGLSAAPGINPLIQVTNLPFPGLYQHGVVRIPALVRPEASPLPPPAPEQISKPASETLDFSGFNFKGPPPPPEPSSGRGQAVLPTTRTGGFFSQLGRRNSHKRPQNVLTHTGPRDRIGMISSPITATHNPWPTGGGPEALRSGMPPRGPRPLGARAIGTAALPGQTRFKSISGSTPPSQVIEAESSASLPSALKLLKSTRLSRHRSSFAYGTSSHHKPEPQPTTTLQSLMRHGAEERGGPEWDAKILKLMDILPQASRKSLEQVLANEHGDDVAAIVSMIFFRFFFLFFFLSKRTEVGDTDAHISLLVCGYVAGQNNNNKNRALISNWKAQSLCGKSELVERKTGGVERENDHVFSFLFLCFMFCYLKPI